MAKKLPKDERWQHALAEGMAPKGQYTSIEGQKYFDFGPPELGILLPSRAEQPRALSPDIGASHGSPVATSEKFRADRSAAIQSRAKVSDTKAAVLDPTQKAALKLIANLTSSMKDLGIYDEHFAELDRMVMRVKSVRRKAS